MATSLQWQENQDGSHGGHLGWRIRAKSIAFQILSYWTCNKCFTSIGWTVATLLQWQENQDGGHGSHLGWLITVKNISNSYHSEGPCKQMDASTIVTCSSLTRNLYGCSGGCGGGGWTSEIRGNNSNICSLARGILRGVCSICDQFSPIFNQIGQQMKRVSVNGPLRVTRVMVVDLIPSAKVITYSVQYIQSWSHCLHVYLLT